MASGCSLPPLSMVLAALILAPPQTPIPVIDLSSAFSIYKCQIRCFLTTFFCLFSYSCSPIPVCSLKHQQCCNSELVLLSWSSLIANCSWTVQMNGSETFVVIFCSIIKLFQAVQFQNFLHFHST